MARILAFGDSITHGVWDTEGGWVQRVRTVLDTKAIETQGRFDCSTYNLGLSGDSTESLLKRFQSEIEVRSQEKQALIILLAIGINDSQFYNADKRLQVSQDQFEQNLKKLVSQAKAFTDKVLLIGLTPVDEPMTDPMQWKPEASYRNDLIEQYDKVLQEVAQSESLPFLNTQKAFKAEDYKKLLQEGDGVHLNNDGHALMSRLVLKKLEEKDYLPEVS